MGSSISLVFKASTGNLLRGYKKVPGLRDIHEHARHATILEHHMAVHLHQP